MDKWLASWTKKHYPDSKRDLCACFIERGFTLAKPEGYSAMVTMQSWMFLGSFEAMREKMLKERSIASMAHLGTRAFDAIGGEVVATTAAVFGNGSSDDPASYLRLVDFDGEASKEEAIREAIANPSCGCFYRRSSDSFKSIPGTPIAYWASDAMLKAFCQGDSLGSRVRMPYGFKTGDNDRFLRMWWECPSNETAFPNMRKDASSYKPRWVPYNKGGSYRKWYGNNDYLLDFQNDGEVVIGEASGEGRSAADYDHALFFKELVTWSRISSGRLALRHVPQGSISDMTGSSMFGASRDLSIIQGFCNSSVAVEVSEMLSPTLDFQPGQVATYPLLGSSVLEPKIERLVETLRCISKRDYDSFEVSWDFGRHPLV